MKKCLNVGLLGFGAMGRVHSYSVNNLKFYYPSLPFDAKVRGVCTTSIQKSNSIKEQYGFDLAAKDEDELIND